MSTARFARSGRLRICVLMGMFFVLIMMIVIYHMSQHQLDESRAFRVRCEANQEGLNEQLQSLTEQKFMAEKKLESMRSEKLTVQQSHDARLSDAVHKHQETLRALSERYEAQVDRNKLLEGKYKDLEAEYVKSKKQHLEDTNAFEQKLQSLLTELQKDKSAKEGEVAAWKEKYETLLRESEHKTHSLEATITEYKAHCDYVPKVQPAEAPQQLNKPASQTPETTRRSSPAQMVHSIEKPRNDKSFNEQVQIVPKTVKSSADELKHDQQQQEEPVLPVSPLSAPRKSSSAASAADAAGQGAGDAPPNASVASKPSSSSGLPPLAMPPPKQAERRLPENVAPIPDNFEDKADNKADGGDVDTAAEELPKNENSKNNRYANVVNDLDQGKALGVAPKPNEDSGAHEVKDFMNEQNFNLPAAAAADNHFFDGEAAAQGAGVADEPLGNKHMVGQAEAGDDDDDLMGNVADVAVKPQQNLLDADNLNNEIAGDQGKEFPEGLHLDDGMEEDQDEDEYPNLAARKGAEAIRH